MTAAIMAFGIAVGIATLTCYLLMTRLQNRRVISGFSRDGFGWVGGADIGDGGSHFVWSGNDSIAAGHSGAANDCGGGGSGGGDGGEGDGEGRRRRGNRRRRLTIRRNDLHSELLRLLP